MCVNLLLTRSYPRGRRSTAGVLPLQGQRDPCQDQRVNRQVEPKKTKHTQTALHRRRVWISMSPVDLYALVCSASAGSCLIVCPGCRRLQFPGFGFPRAHPQKRGLLSRALVRSSLFHVPWASNGRPIKLLFCSLPSAPRVQEQKCLLPLAYCRERINSRPWSVWGSTQRMKLRWSGRASPKNSTLAEPAALFLLCNLHSLPRHVSRIISRARRRPRLWRHVSRLSFPRSISLPASAGVRLAPHPDPLFVFSPLPSGAPTTCLSAANICVLYTARVSSSS